MDKRSLAWGAILLFIAVGMGAFGSHGLKVVLAPDALAQWRTAVEYQFYHGLGLVFLAALGSHLPARRLRLIRSAFVAGIALFCGSVYLLSIRDLVGIQALSPVLGPITPLGGLCFLAGWGILFVTAICQPDGR